MPLLVDQVRVLDTGIRETGTIIPIFDAPFQPCGSNVRSIVVTPANEVMVVVASGPVPHNAVITAPARAVVVKQ